MPANIKTSFLSKWLGAGQSTVHPAPPPVARPEAKASALEELRSFEQKLNQIAAQQDVVVASNLHVLNIAKIKEKVGERWPRLSKVIQLNIEAIIEQHLEPGDEVLRRSEMNYVIVFTKSDKAETSRRLQAISHEIIERVFGTDALLEGFELQSTAAHVDAATLGERDTLTNIFAELNKSDWKQTFSMDSLRKEQATEGAGPQQIVSNAKETLQHARTLLGRVSANADLNEFIAMLEKLSPALAEARESCATLMASGRMVPGISPDELEKVLQVTTTYSEAIDRLRTKVARYNGAYSGAGVASSNEYILDPDAHFTAKASEAEPASVLDNVVFNYRPVWDPQKGIITTFRCEMGRKDGKSRRSLERLFAGHDLARAHFQMDYALLRHAIRDVKKLVERQGRCAIVVPINYSTLANTRDRTVIVQALNHLSEHEQKLLLLEVVNIDANTWSSRISEVIGFLRSHCGAVLLRLPPGYRFLSDLKQAGAYAVGHDVAELKLREANIFDELENLCSMAEKTKIKIFLSGVHAVSLASGAIGAGVNLLDGSLLPTDLPLDCSRFALADLYSAQFAS